MGLGESYASFWDLTPREYVIVSRAIVKRREQEIEVQRYMNHELAQLIAYAYHDPKNMPEPGKSARGPEEMTEQEGAARMRAGLVSLMQLQNNRR